MAWCRECERYLTPATLTAEGSCPSCGAEVDHPPERQGPHAGPHAGPHDAIAPTPADAAPERIPWHFWLLLCAAAAYLAWRAVQGATLLLALPGVTALA